MTRQEHLTASTILVMTALAAFAMGCACGAARVWLGG
jgi:hypothetical protein